MRLAPYTAPCILSQARCLAESTLVVAVEIINPEPEVQTMVKWKSLREFRPWRWHKMSKSDRYWLLQAAECLVDDWLLLSSGFAAGVLCGYLAF